MIQPFKCEHSLFRSLADGYRTFDFRRWDEDDPRINRLEWFNLPATIQARPPDSDLVAFIDKETGEVIYFYFEGIRQIPGGPGWVIIHLGERADPSTEKNVE